MVHNGRSIEVAPEFFNARSQSSRGFSVGFRRFERGRCGREIAGHRERLRGFARMWNTLIFLPLRFTDVCLIRAKNSTGHPSASFLFDPISQRHGIVSNSMLHFLGSVVDIGISVAQGSPVTAEIFIPSTSASKITMLRAEDITRMTYSEEEITSALISEGSPVLN
jgi:hypothetical protein